MERGLGFEPVNKGFADLCLTTWLPRLDWIYNVYPKSRLPTDQKKLGVDWLRNLFKRQNEMSRP